MEKKETAAAAPAKPAAGAEVTTPSGLKYVVITSGSGKTPGPADKVTVHYQMIAKKVEAK